MKHVSRLSGLCQLVLLSLLTASSLADEDVYEEPAWYQFRKKAVLIDTRLRIPAWPDLSQAIRVSLDLDNFPFSLLIDPASLQMVGPKVIRYTAILKSVDGAINVSYEGIHCARKQYIRYAYGASGVFVKLPRPRWVPLTSSSTDRYRQILMKNYFCPLPGRNRTDRLISRLKSDRADVLLNEQED